MSRVLFLLLLTVCSGWARDVSFNACKKIRSGATKGCKVKSVEIEGCQEPTPWVDIDEAIIEYRDTNDPKTPCRFGSGSVLNITIQYEPGFNADFPRSQFSMPFLEECWEDTVEQCPLPTTSSEACDHTKCPLISGHSRVFERSLEVSSSFPKRSVNARKVYQMKWKMWDNKNKDKSCCINFPMQY